MDKGGGKFCNSSSATYNLPTIPTLNMKHEYGKIIPSKTLHEPFETQRKSSTCTWILIENYTVQRHTTFLQLMMAIFPLNHAFPQLAHDYAI